MKPRVISEGDRHFYLYAKHHYQQTSLLNDLRRITAYQCALNIDDVEDCVIKELLLDLVHPHLVNQNDFASFMACLAPEGVWRVGGNAKAPYNHTEAVIRACLSVLGRATVFDPAMTPILVRGEADKNVLPLSSELTRRKKDERKKSRKRA